MSDIRQPRTLRLLLTSLAVAATALVAATGPAGADHATQRWSGPDRVATAIEVSASTFEDAATVLVASAAGFADALAAAPLAGALGGPVLLNPPDALDARVDAEVARLGADQVFVLGGRAALSDDVVAALRADGRTVTRISGSDRFGTAAEVADRVVARWRSDGDADAGTSVIVALGDHPQPSRAWPDALAAGVLAGRSHRPLLLVRPGDVPVATRQALADLGAQDAIVVGGAGAIPDAVADDLGIPWRRVRGASRYGTGVAVLEEAVAAGADPTDVTVVTGRGFADALGAGPSALARGGVLLLVDGADLDGSPEARAWLEGSSPAAVTVVGGRSAVTDRVVEQVEAALHGTTPPGPLRLALERVVSARTPLAVRSDASEPDVLYVVERAGTVLRVDDGPASPVVSTFLDISDRVGTSGERGLLDLVLHPDFATNGRFFVHYNDRTNGDTVLSEFRRSGSDPSRAAAAEAELYRTTQPASNHNGGGLAFLPDGTLLLALGDGGGANDTFGNGQNLATPLGSLLRFDVSTAGTATVPSDNPYVGQPGRDPWIWASGLRNPWRISLDGPSGVLYVADVGQNRVEEVDAVGWDRAGLDYGWSTMEGDECFRIPACDRSGLQPPAHVYRHESGRCSITGGHVHRGAIPELRGHYFFGDLCTGEIWSLRIDGGAATDVQDWSDDLGGGLLYSFGLDARGEVYVLRDAVYRIVRD